MTKTDAVQNAELNGNKPLQVAVTPNSVASTTATPGLKKDLAYFRREVSTVTLAFWRSSKLLADVLIDARLALSPEDFMQLISEAQFDYSFVCKLIRQGSDYRMNDPDNDPILPEAFSSRHEIMLMSESTFRIGLTKGIIHKNCKLEDLRKLREQMDGKKKATKKTEQKRTAPAATTTKVMAEEKSNVTEITQAKLASVRAESKVPLQMPKKPVEFLAEKSRIVVYLAPETAEKNRDQIAALKEDLGRFVAKYPFIESVEMADAA
jgi:hypothetical protein